MDDPLNTRRHSDGDAAGLATLAVLRAGRGENTALTEAVDEFVAAVDNDGFPCIYAKNALKQGTLLYAHIVWNDPQSDVKDFARLVSDFLRLLDTEAPAKAAMMALVVFFDVPRHDGTASLEPVAWEIVQALMDADPVGALAAGPVDDPSWALVFEGVPLFINISSPEHVHRRSHNVGRRLTMIVQPRAGIDFFAPPNEDGDRIREMIRCRLDAYDAIPRSPDLSTHGSETNRDWKQYWLSDDPSGQLTECPLRSPLDVPAR